MWRRGHLQQLKGCVGDVVPVLGHGPMAMKRLCQPAPTTDAVTTLT